MTSGIWGSPSPGWEAAEQDRLHHPWAPPWGLGVWWVEEPLPVGQDPLWKAVEVPLGWPRSCHCWRYRQRHHRSPEWELRPLLGWGWAVQERLVLALRVLSLVSGLVLAAELELQEVP